MKIAATGSIDKLVLNEKTTVTGGGTKPQTIPSSFTATGDVGIAPESAGDAAGNIYAEYKLTAGEDVISLAASNVEYIKVKVGSGDWTDLTANTDATLWFNVEAANGARSYEVKTKDGKVYTATLDWDKVIKEATWKSTGKEGTRPGTLHTYVEYELMNENVPVPLKASDVKLVALEKADGKWDARELNQDSTLWFYRGNSSGNYKYLIVTNEGEIYRATLPWTIPDDVKEVNVRDLSGLQVALSNEKITTINITANITKIRAPIEVTRPVTINGGGKTLSFTGLEAITGSTVDDGLIIYKEASGTVINGLTVNAGLANSTDWAGTYAIHVHDSAATLNDVKATGGNGGILVNGSNVTLTGTIDVSGNGFGGIEVSNGGATTNELKLDVANATLTNTSEAYGLPTIWEDKVTKKVTTKDNQFVANTKVEDGQVQYYVKAANAVDPAAITALTTYLQTAKEHIYGTATNWMDISGLTVAGTTVTADFALAEEKEDDLVLVGIKVIYDKLVKDKKINESGNVTGADGNKKNAIEYAIDSYVMNTFARYLGALEYKGPGTVAKIVFDGTEYTWQEKAGEGSGYLAASNWRGAGKTTLVSKIVLAQENAIRNVKFTIVDEEGYSIDVTFEAKNVPTTIE